MKSHWLQKAAQSSIKLQKASSNVSVVSLQVRSARAPRAPRIHVRTTSMFAPYEHRGLQKPLVTNQSIPRSPLINVFVKSLLSEINAGALRSGQRNSHTTQTPRSLREPGAPFQCHIPMSDVNQWCTHVASCCLSQKNPRSLGKRPTDRTCP